MIDSHFCWMERRDGRLLTPRSDGYRYEHPVDWLFATKDEAFAFLDEERDVYEADEHELAYIGTWVLCRRTVETVE